MNIITLDFETFFSDDYTLSKMTTEAYIRDPRFEAHGVGMRWRDGKAIWFPRGGGPKWRTGVDWSKVTILCHHAAFDGLILSHHFGITPARWLDTYSMARMLFGPEQSKSLGALAERYGLAAKSVPYDMMRGRHWSELSAAEQRTVADGCLHDCELAWTIFEKMLIEFPACELPVIDATIRMFTEPRLIGDQKRLREIHEREVLEKNERLYALGVGERDLASADKFKSILEAEGIEVGMKEGKPGKDGTPRFIPALAKTDEFMKELLDHDDERIRELAQARLDVKSTINETRSARLLEMAGRGPLAIYLSYCGAHTRRWSGGDDLNFQNLGRASDLRRAIVAPPGHLLACPDQSQGECRGLNWFAGQQDVVERFARGENPYEPIASKYYRRPITKASDPLEYGFGKQLELSCGFGAGGPKIVETARRGTYGPPVDLSQEEGLAARDLYRDSHPMVVRLWSSATYDVLPALANKKSAPFLWQGLIEVRGGRLYHPNGTWLDYSRLRYEDGEWRLYKRKGEWVKMYGAKLVENVVQWLSRIITAEAIVRYRAAGYPIVGMAHDDVWLLVPDDGDHADVRKQEIIDIMATTPVWAPGLPLAADCKMGRTYGG
jgi:hypothetical protein